MNKVIWRVNTWMVVIVVITMTTTTTITITITIMMTTMMMMAVMVIMTLAVMIMVMAIETLLSNNATRICMTRSSSTRRTSTISLSRITSSLSSSRCMKKRKDNDENENSTVCPSLTRTRSRIRRQALLIQQRRAMNNTFGWCMAIIFSTMIQIQHQNCVFVSAAYPAELHWSACGNNHNSNNNHGNNNFSNDHGNNKNTNSDNNNNNNNNNHHERHPLCATLEFCQDGSSFGYRIPSSSSSSPSAGSCGSRPGPLIRLEPGVTYILTLYNSATATTTTTSTTTTNLHAHGLHIVGDGNSDDATRFVTPGSCIDYTWDIPIDHPGGTYWYHPHYFPHTHQQTNGGAYGLIVVDDDESQLHSWAWRQNEILLQISKTMPSSSSSSSPSSNNNDEDGTVRGNGLTNERFHIDADRWYRFRVSIVVPNATPGTIQFIPKSSSTSSVVTCTVYKVASDGIWHTASFTTYSGPSFIMTGASRADFAVKCQPSTDDGGVVVNADTDTNTDILIQWNGQTAATITVNTEDGKLRSRPNAHGDDLGTAPIRPMSLRNVDTEIVPAFNMYDVTLSDTSINDATWDPDIGLGDIAWDQVHEWTIYHSNQHPFHLHLYHMLIIEPDGCGPGHVYGEFYDVLSSTTTTDAGPASPCRVRFKAADFGQRMVMHSHSLSEFDSGAITFMHVVSKNAPKNTIDSPSYICGNGGTTRSLYSSSPSSSSTMTVTTTTTTETTPRLTTTSTSTTCSTTTCINDDDCCNDNKCNTSIGICSSFSTKNQTLSLRGSSTSTRQGRDDYDGDGTTTRTTSTTTTSRTAAPPVTTATTATAVTTLFSSVS